MTMNIDQFKKLLDSNWENGGRLVPANVACILCLAYGVTTDFLFMGNVGGLPHEMAVAYKELFPV